MTQNDDKPNYRLERIERLLKDLEYEVVRGMMEREIPEELGFRFVVPISNSIHDGVVNCEFRTRPFHRAEMFSLQPTGARLTVIKGGKP